MSIKGAIFDMDGTLLDSMHIWIGIGERYLETKNITVTPEIKQGIKGMMLGDMSRYFINNLGFNMTAEEIIQDINKLVEDEYFHRAQPKPGIPELLESFKNVGVKMCVATATDRYMAEAALKRCGLMDYFGALFTCSEAGANKTDPLIYFKALDFLGTEKNETYIFEDTLIPVRTAKKAGFPIVAVQDKWSERNAEVIRSEADIYIENAFELKNKAL